MIHESKMSKRNLRHKLQLGKASMDSWESEDLMRKIKGKWFL